MNGHDEGMLGRERAQRLLEDVLRRASAEGTEAVLSYERGALTRFADSYIHQNVNAVTPQLTVRAVFGRRVGSASTARLDDAGLARVVEQAESIARLASEDDTFPGLPEPSGEPGEAAYSAATAACGPQERAALAGIACGMARESGLSASGSVTTVGHELAVANSRGVFAYTPRSWARLVVVAIGASGSGRATDTALDLAALDMEAVAGRAVEIARRAQNPAETPPGDYTVILQPEAVADVAHFLCTQAFGAMAVYEQRSFLAGKRGERVLGSNVTIRDDGGDPAGLPLPFDYEGVPRQRLALIDGGVAGDIAVDTRYAALMDTHTSGHALPAAADFYAGPVPRNLFMAPGEASVEEMIRSTERGLLVTRFNYTRVVHPLHIIVTGMTRDGTFLIENGEVTRAVKNLRFTQSYVEALRDVQAIGRATRLCDEGTPARVPALKIGSFTFTGVTQ